MSTSIEQYHEGYGIALQPVCDIALRHVADKLLYRESASANSANVEDAMQATSRSCAAALFEIGLEELVGDRCLLCTIPEQWVMEPDLVLYPPEQTVLEIPSAIFADEAGWIAVRRLQERGFRIALERQAWEHAGPGRLGPVAIVKTDFRHSQMPPMVGGNDDHRPIHMATFIETSEQLEQAQHAGFDWLQGFVFSLPIIVQRATHRRSGNRAVELQLLAMLARHDLDFHDLEPLIAQHPSLVTRLLRQVNSAAFGRLRAPIETLSEAMVRLGTQHIHVLISTFMIAGNDPIRAFQARELLIRAAMASNLAERVASVSSTVAFSVGLFSQLHLFEGQDMEDLIQDLPFSADIKGALLMREGELGKLIQILDAFQAGSLNGLAKQTTAMLNEDYLKAVTWADRWLRIDDPEAAD